MDISGADAAEKLAILVRAVRPAARRPGRRCRSTASAASNRTTSRRPPRSTARSGPSRRRRGTAARSTRSSARRSSAARIRSRASAASPTASSSAHLRQGDGGQARLARLVVLHRSRRGTRRHRRDAAGRRGGAGDRAARADAGRRKRRKRRSSVARPHSGWFVRARAARRVSPTSRISWAPTASGARALARRGDWIYALTCSGQRRPAAERARRAPGGHRR